jgi:dipeptidase E
VPFQTNPHYTELDPASPPGAESRDQRLAEFLQENDVPVVALREGAWIDVRDDSISVGGPTGARLFQRGQEPRDLAPGSKLTDLLATVPRYDTPLE